jgi:hypothetical protein
MRMKTQAVTLRLPTPILKRLDKWLKHQTVTGAKFTRTTVIRDLLLAHLSSNHVEAAHDQD